MDSKRGERFNTVAALQEIQDRKGYLPRADLVRLSRLSGIAGTDIFSVVTFYSQFRLTPPARHTVCVCTGTACHVRGSAGIMKYMEEALGIKKNETAKNGLIRLESVNCIGACARAPAVTADGRVYGQMTKPKAQELLEKLK